MNAERTPVTSGSSGTERASAIGRRPATVIPVQAAHRRRVLRRDLVCMIAAKFAALTLLWALFFHNHG
jgi:hypothetical protein